MSFDRHHLAWLGIALLCTAALAIRAVVAQEIVYPTVDGVNYMTIARTLVREGSLQYSTFPPGWPLVLSLPLPFTGAESAMDFLRAAQVANVVLGTVAVLLTFVLLRRSFGEVVGLLAALVVAALPDLLIMSTVDMSELSYLVILVGAFLALRAQREILTGLLFGYAYLIRPEAVLVLAIVVLVRSIARRRLLWKPVAVAALFVVPYVVFVHAATGEWSLSSKGVFLEVATAEASPGDIVSRWWRNAGQLVGGLLDIVGLPLVALALWGMARRPRIEMAALVAMPILPIFSFAMDARYWIPMVPLLLLFAADGGRDLTQRAPSSRARRIAAVGLVVLTIAGIGVAAAPDVDQVGVNHEAFAGMRDAGSWLAENSDPEAVVVGYKPYVAFWAQRQFAKLPVRADALATVDRIRESGFDYLVVNVTMVRSVAPQLAPLLAPNDLDPRLARKVELVHVATVPGDPRQTTALYRIVPIGASFRPGGA